MSRIGRRFEALRAQDRKAFIAFVTTGDPSLERTVEIAVTLGRAGVDVLELGVPFSDPMADGPVIQRSSERALRNGTTLGQVLAICCAIRQNSDIPLLLFSYLNPLLRYGLEAFARDAREAGADGVLVTDLPPDEADEWVSIARAQDLDTVFLASPTSPYSRLRRVASLSRGFVYAISRTGITGEKSALSSEAAPLVEILRELTSLPVALGFGISTRAQVQEASRFADGVVVGSALVRLLEKDPNADLGSWVQGLRAP